MEKNTLNQYLKEVSVCDPKKPWDTTLQMFSDDRLSVYYAPFEHLNKKAKVVLCGITPGATQAMEALNIAKSGVIAGLTVETVQEQAKQAASFKGFRKPLSQMLDLVGLHEKLEIESCDQLFGIHAGMVHYTSAIRYPTVLSNGNNYNGTPKASRHPQLRRMLDKFLAEEVEELGQNCLWIPLGTAATEALEYLVEQGTLKPSQLISGLPHPSGANAERIAYFLGNKPKDRLSNKVNPSKLDAAKISLLEKIKAA
ncbi:hypothetical protein [Vibrio sp. MA40-2]|uniref:hypothetical protein n=1 Tax=Vibrio sp. MA40-2 TaxID=3391828 RepID=UPI0039A7580C